MIRVLLGTRPRTAGAQAWSPVAIAAHAALSRWAVPAGAVAVAALLALTGMGADAEHGLAAWRASLHPRHASGRVALVEIDAKSLAAIDHWPWSRSVYASAITALDRAGARTIALDVDFSARSRPRDDAALARAIAASSTPVVLPTFLQVASQASTVRVENLPIPELRRPSLLAAVNIQADPDGLVRSYPYGVETSGAARPSVGALLADGAGTSGQSFLVDGAIDPATIPRLSVVDLLQGRFSPTTLRGVNVLIGATAIELGDRYPMPGRGVVPGALIQLLAAETLIQQSSPLDHGPFLPVMVMVAMTIVGARRKRAGASLVFMLGAGLLLVLPLAMEMAKLGTVSIVPALVGLVGAWMATLLLGAYRATREARHFDQDTGLPNLRSLTAQLTAEGAAAAFVYRLANHGNVSGVAGHAAASDLARQVAGRIADITGQLVYRVEENALAWLMAEEDPVSEGVVAEDVAAAMRTLFRIAGRRVEAEGAIGIAPGSTGGTCVAHAAAAADAAIVGGVRWMRYDEAMGQEKDWRVRIVGEVDDAMAAGDIWVAYQPKYDLVAARICSAEALVRWRHPERGPIPPDAFIPVLEESGRIADLTLYVLEQAIADQQTWAAAGREFNVAVNISARLPSDGDFVRRLEALLERNPGVTKYLTLEVTESAAMTDPEASIAALERLAQLGVALSIDDYGTGQSTLSYLKRLPASEIKIDKSFVKSLETNRNDQAMVRSTIDLAHELGFRVVAEGVETMTVLTLLQEYGCDVAQGWCIGKPGSASDLLTFATPLDLAA